MSEGHYFECECCDRPVVAGKKPGLGYLCDPCVKCFTADPPLTGDEPLPDGVTCYFVEDLAWMQRQVDVSEWNRRELARARAAAQPTEGQERGNG